jgi:hypothetical protein
MRQIQYWESQQLLKGEAMAVRVPIKRPAYYSTFSKLMSGQTDTSRVCSNVGCDEAAPVTRGYYLVESRRVRVWVCQEHAISPPSTLLPTPPDIVTALRKEQEHLDQVNRSMRMTPQPDHGVSVRVLASTGHGTALPFDRVASFRWEPTPASIANKKKRRKGRAA